MFCCGSELHPLSRKRHQALKGRRLARNTQWSWDHACGGACTHVYRSKYSAHLMHYSKVVRTEFRQRLSFSSKLSSKGFGCCQTKGMYILFPLLLLFQITVTVRKEGRLVTAQLAAKILSCLTEQTEGQPGPEFQVGMQIIGFQVLFSKNGYCSLDKKSAALPTQQEEWELLIQGHELHFPSLPFPTYLLTLALGYTDIYPLQLLNTCLICKENTCFKCQFKHSNN